MDVAELTLVCGSEKGIYLCLDCCYIQAEVVPYRKNKREQRRKIDGVILKEISPEYSLEGLMLKLKLQYFGHLM